MDLELLVIGKKTGLSFDEMNMMRVCDLLDYVSIYHGKRPDRARNATQQDIDALLG